MKVLDHRRIGGPGEAILRSLSANIIGQEEAVRKLVQIYQLYQSDLRLQPNKPICSVALLGPTGTGKTHSVEVLAEALHGNRKHMIRIDCAELFNSHDTSRMTGAPPGYTGHKETKPPIDQASLNKVQSEKNKVSIVLFDEIEKAQDSLFNLLLGIMDKGILSTNDGKKVNFENSMIFFSSNVGSRQIQENIENKWGYGSQSAYSGKSMESTINRALLKRFSPEFVNRLTHKILYQPLSKESAEQIFDLELAKIDEQLAAKCIRLSVSEEAKEAIIDRGYSRTMGARNLNRQMEEALINPLSNLLASNQLHTDDLIEVSFSSKDSQFAYLQASRRRRRCAP